MRDDAAANYRGADCKHNKLAWNETCGNVIESTERDLSLLSIPSHKPSVCFQNPRSSPSDPGRRKTQFERLLKADLGRKWMNSGGC